MIKKSPKFYDSISYLDTKMKEYLGDKCKTRNISFEQCEIFIKRLKGNHTKEQLLSIEDSINIECEMTKQIGFKQTFISAIYTVLVGTCVALFTFFNTTIQNEFAFFGKSLIDTSKDKGEALNDIQRLFTETFNMSLNRVATPMFYELIIIVIIICMFYILMNESKLKK